MKESLTSVILVISAIIFKESNAYFKPSFVSKWHKIESQEENSQIKIAHYLKETPIKVIADVKVGDFNNEFIFRGMGAPERDDDVNQAYGGVSVAYNEHYVELRAPKKHNHFATGHVIDTGLYVRSTAKVIYGREKLRKKEKPGSSASWTGSEKTRSYEVAMVRVRVWKMSDLPVPSFISNWIYVNTQEGLRMYNDIPHFMKSYPDLVNLQVTVGFKEELIFEGQGSSSVLKRYPKHVNSGGAVFGYSDESVRVWFMKGAHVFTTQDGWGKDSNGAKEGLFRIIAWKFKESETSTIEERSFKEIMNVNGNLELENIIVNAQFEVRSGRHAGFRFYGIGSTMNDGGPDSKYGLCGGMVYAFTKSNIRMWIPKKKHGFTFNYGGEWGNKSFHQSTNDVSFRVQLIQWNKVGTTTPNGVNCSTENLTVSTATTLLNVTGSRYMSVATYNCSEHHRQIGGDPYRYCQNDSTWSNLTLDCYRVNCSTENLTVSTATTLLNVTGSRYMSVATYNCSEHHRQIGGDPYRYCQNDSTWSKLTLDCQRCRCRCLNESDNRLKDIMSQTKQQLTVKKQKLSNFIRKKTSAKDERPTSKGIGAAGAVVLVVTLLVAVVPDLPLLHRQLTDAWRNVRSGYKIKKRNQIDPKL